MGNNKSKKISEIPQTYSVNNILGGDSIKQKKRDSITRSNSILNEDKNFLKLCNENILNNILDNNILALKDIIEHNYLCEIYLDNIYKGSFSKIINIDKKKKIKDFDSLYFKIQNKTSKEEGNYFKCTFKLHNNNLIQIILISAIIQKILNKKFDIQNHINLIEFIKKTKINVDTNNTFEVQEIGKDGIGWWMNYRDGHGNTFAHIVALYDQLEIAKYCIDLDSGLKVLNNKYETPFLTSIRENKKSQTSKYFNDLLLGEHNKNIIEENLKNNKRKSSQRIYPDITFQLEKPSAPNF